METGPHAGGDISAVEGSLQHHAHFLLLFSAPRRPDLDGVDKGAHDRDVFEGGGKGSPVVILERPTYVVYDVVMGNLDTE